MSSPIRACSSGPSASDAHMSLVAEPPVDDALLGAAATARRATSLSPNQRAWARFKRNRLGYRLAVRLRRDARRRHPSQRCSPASDRWSHDTKANGSSLSSPTLPIRDSAVISRRRPTGTTRSSSSASPADGNFALFTFNEFGDNTLDYYARGGRPGRSRQGPLAGDRFVGSRHRRQASLRLSGQHSLRHRAHARRHDPGRADRRRAGIFRRAHRSRRATPHRDLEFRFPRFIC